MITNFLIDVYVKLTEERENNYFFDDKRPFTKVDSQFSTHQLQQMLAVLFRHNHWKHKKIIFYISFIQGEQALEHNKPILDEIASTQGLTRRTPNWCVRCNSQMFCLKYVTSIEHFFDVTESTVVARSLCVLFNGFVLHNYSFIARVSKV